MKPKHFKRKRHIPPVDLFFLVVALLTAGCIDRPPAPPLKIPLDGSWEFSARESGIFHPASVPGCVHLDLMALGHIEDPFYRNNEEAVQWIEEKDWTYQTAFLPGKGLPGYDSLELVFEGLDTYAEIFLNDSLVLTTDNMFRQYVVGLQKELLEDTLRLRVDFLSPVRINAEKAARLPFQLPDPRAFSRKAPYQFGWDWGPRLVTSGIWKPVFIRAWDRARLETLHIVLDSLNDSSATLHAEATIVANGDHPAEITIDIPGILRVNKSVMLHRGINTVLIPFAIQEPRLWWTHNLGEPFLYDLNFSIASDGIILASARENLGIRTLELVQEKDEQGTSFSFVLNGIPVFMKGANMIPLDNFPSRVSREKFDRVVENAVTANMNMLRVWGGGIYENDHFYDLCDRAGILVWQDFMFACAMYPPGEEFAQNVAAEASQQVERLRDHPCIALWCGNNEVDEGWKNWGWQEQLGYTEEDALTLWEAYENIFHTILPGMINAKDSLRPYWPSSPKIGWGHPESLLEGDSHYWGVWWGEEPFETYDVKIGRFMSEYGFQAYPHPATIIAFTDVPDRQTGSKILKAHQKHPRGEEIIRKYMERDFPVPPSLDDYAYVSQLSQAEGVARAIRAHRRAMPWCMGTLFWQLNDCWPVISWSSTDYYNRWKALHYFAAKAYENILVDVNRKNGRLCVHVISDLQDTVRAGLALQLLRFNGEVTWSRDLDIAITPGSSIYFETAENILPGYSEKNRVCLKAELTSNGEVQARDLCYFSRSRELDLEDPGLGYDVDMHGDTILLRIHAKQLARYVFLDIPGMEGHFSDNFFDLLPGEEKRVEFISETPVPPGKSLPVSIKTLNDLMK